MEKQKMYIVAYCVGYSEYSWDTIVFVTSNIMIAKKYCLKFNRMLEKWKKHYSQYETKKYGSIWIKDEFSKTKYHRWAMLRDLRRCHFDEVEIR
jgi:hypothetical protein